MKGGGGAEANGRQRELLETPVVGERSKEEKLTEE